MNDLFSCNAKDLSDLLSCTAFRAGPDWGSRREAPELLLLGRCDRPEVLWRLPSRQHTMPVHTHDLLRKTGLVTPHGPSNGPPIGILWVTRTS